MNQIIKKIEKKLSITLEPYQYREREENAYEIRQGKIHELYLNDVEIESFEEIKEIYGLTIKNSRVRSLSELLKLNVYRLTIENIIFNNIDHPITVNDTLLNFRIESTYFNAKSLSKCTSLKFAFFYDCKIENVYEISCFPKLHQLHFRNIEFGKIGIVDSTPAENHSIFDISDMTFENINFFLPFVNIKNLRISNCHIKSISSLHKFKKLQRFEIDSDSTIENTEFTKHNHQNICCEITQGKQPIDLQKLFPIINYIDKLSFHSFKESKLYFIENFTKVTSLIFEKSDIYLDAFLPIASQIETLSIQDSSFKETKHLKEFTKLSTIETNSDDLGIQSLKELFPLKKQLKSLVSWDEEFKDLEYINEFSALEYLQIGSVEISAAIQILKLIHLKHLYLYVDLGEDDNKENLVLDLKNLTKLESLNISYEQVNATGYEYLKQLKSLKIEYGINVINSFPRMESLERLNIEGEGRIDISLEQFPNLRELKVEGLDVNLSLNLPRLEILEIPNINNIDFQVEMPNLKRLYLPKTNNFLEIFKKTPNITHLDFEEFEQDDLTVLKPLKKLEYLNLLRGTVSDIRILNSLPRLKEVNLSGLKHLEYQLKESKTAVYYWINRRHFFVYKEDDLWI
ncbi:hypothetical protein [Aquimarina aquimarini]|uniref:hypothetical protein n=1 Tax=Aquimarina aquimarini TaxID=1191734 RepID=UPI000D55F50E|nr:hypothetical protein [Aquimarina aquimarini]